MLCILSGAVTGDARASFVFALFAGLFYLAQLRISVPTMAVLLDPGTLLRVPLLIVFSLTAGLMSHGRSGRAGAGQHASRLRPAAAHHDVARGGGRRGDRRARRDHFLPPGRALSPRPRPGHATAAPATRPFAASRRARAAGELAHPFHRGRPAYAEHLFGERRFTRTMGLNAMTAFLVPANFSDAAGSRRRVPPTQIDSEPEAEFLITSPNAPRSPSSMRE